MQELEDGLFLVNYAYTVELNRYAFNEWRGTLSGVGTSRVHVFDLNSGKRAARYDGKHVILIGWRKDSPEFVAQQPNSNRTSDWYAYSGVRRRRRLLLKGGKGGQQGYMSSDGRYLLVVSPGELAGTLVDVETGRVLDSKSAKDFRAFACNAKNLVTIKFDADAPRLIRALNYSSMDHGSQTVDFEKALAIEISQP
jgi:hypothetical protein